MIDASELRIGNWVNHKDIYSYRNEMLGKEFYFQWESRDWYALGECTISLEDINPIPLTEEILEKCGFDMNPDWNNYDGCVAVLDLGYLYIGKGVMGGITLFQNNHFSTGVNIDYLHQLQNLIYAITQTELNYQP